MGAMQAASSLGDRAKAEVESVLESEIFVRSPRLARLLNYLCIKYFAGEVDQIKEYNIAVDVLERPASFDPAEDAIARVEVHRLRKKLREYYATEGAGHELRIAIPTGHYAPVFLPAAGSGHEDHQSRNPSSGGGAVKTSQLAYGLAIHADATPSRAAAGRPWWRSAGPLLAIVICICAIFLVLMVRARPMAASNPDASRVDSNRMANLPALPPATGEGVRIACGRQKPYTDPWGRIWAADRYFERGDSVQSPRHFLARSSDPSLYQGARTGDFSYDIPLPRGVYELHLYFVETEFVPAAGGGENSRVFQVAANGRRILSDFDIISDAGGAEIADERVFKDISPASDGLLHLRFMSVRSHATVSAIEVEPAWPHKLNSLRMLAQETSYKDSSGRLWKPDNYWTGGQIGSHPPVVEEIQNPILYARERYGHFSYAIPADEGEYAVTLHFSENYWGRENPGGGGAGSRIFDVLCNGVALLRNFDVYKEAGANRPIVKTFHRLKPTAQGKLELSFVPVHNYASLYAIEVVDETRE